MMRPSRQVSFAPWRAGQRSVTSSLTSRPPFSFHAGDPKKKPALAAGLYLHRDRRPSEEPPVKWAGANHPPAYACRCAMRTGCCFPGRPKDGSGRIACHFHLIASKTVCSPACTIAFRTGPVNRQLDAMSILRGPSRSPGRPWEILSGQGPAGISSVRPAPCSSMVL